MSGGNSPSSISASKSGRYSTTWCLLVSGSYEGPRRSPRRVWLGTEMTISWLLTRFGGGMVVEIRGGFPEFTTQARI